MNTRTAISGALAGVALIAGWSAMQSAAAHADVRSTQLAADPLTVSTDSDGDFIPDVVEWVMMTNSQEADTDGDGVCDFVEVVQNGNPQFVADPFPADHELRVIVSTVDSAAGSQMYLHLLFRFMGSVSLLSSLNTWLELEEPAGVRLSLNQLAVHAVDFQQRLVPNEGLWVRLSVPLASESVLRNLLPFTLGASATIGTRSIATVMPVFDNYGTTAGLVPFNRSQLAVQSLATSPVPGNNRLCLIQLNQVGSSPAGAVFMVSDAECVDYNDLNCGAHCRDSVGNTFTLPGGVSRVTGGN